jgi:hypothetical protein
MNGENTFLITYGLHPFVTHAKDDNKSVFTIRSFEERKMIRHATRLITGAYGKAAAIQVA